MIDTWIERKVESRMNSMYDLTERLEHTSLGSDQNGHVQDLLGRSLASSIPSYRSPSDIMRVYLYGGRRFRHG